MMCADEPMTASSPPGQTSTPHTHTTSTSSNLLHVPVPSSSSGSHHQRSLSFGSSGTSSWTPSALASSDIGEDRSDERDLLKVNEPDIPDNPFAFIPKQLAKLHDPKDLNILRQMGGIEGLAFGLRTDLEFGLSPDEDHLEGRITLQDVWHELETRKKLKVQNGVNKAQEEESTENHEDEDHHEKGHDVGDNVHHTETGSIRRKISLATRRPTLARVISHPPPPKGFSDRKRIFSENRIPARKPKNIFQLMWMALHDKILVYFRIKDVLISRSF